MARTALTPPRQLAIGAAVATAALATVVGGVWLSASGGPRLDAPTDRPALRAAPAALLGAASLQGVRALPGPDAVMLALSPASDTTTDDSVVSAPPGGGLAAQPPAQPPPPSPPPGAEPDPIDEVVGTINDTVDDTEDDADDTIADLDPVEEILQDDAVTPLEPLSPAVEA